MKFRDFHTALLSALRGREGIFFCHRMDRGFINRFVTETRKGFQHEGHEVYPRESGELLGFLVRKHRITERIFLPRRPRRITKNKFVFFRDPGTLTSTAGFVTAGGAEDFERDLSRKHRSTEKMILTAEDAEGKKRATVKSHRLQVSGQKEAQEDLKPDT